MFRFRFYFLVSYLVGMFSSEDVYRFHSFSLWFFLVLALSQRTHRHTLSFTSPHHRIHPIYPTLHRLHGSLHAI
ncbi:hypothetical protein BJ165DRAFT_1519966 [Panaeolus papilionaceus]|nr:hypothetical protein BJ165DRAFT_1519966 [Panaeolus papilionaceus]